jgi:predicted AlkP superfamily phosphohydrolase/phosphomutase
MAMPRVCIIGLDCLAPELVFGELAPRLPNLHELAARGVSGLLESTLPPITVPAWSAMVTGLDPGSLGCYGFHDRADHSYEARRLASSLSIKADTLWSIASRHRLVSRLIGVPQTYPPRPLKGFLVSDAPAGGEPATYPPELWEEVERLSGGYVADLPEHRREERGALPGLVHEMTARRFRLARAWAKEPDWQLLMLVEMGPDRLQHAFWGEAPVIGDYYAALDREVGELVALLSPEDVVFVVSDHGAQANQGGLALNQWLLEHGYLTLTRPIEKPTAFSEVAVDWGRTRAWADGGYVGRIYFNIAGREPRGCVLADEVPELAAELAAELGAERGPAGEPWRIEVHRPAELYREVRGVAPDLTVVIDHFAYRALASLGHPGLFVHENDRGPDKANHARHGVLIMRDGRAKERLSRPASIYDIAPTVLARLGLAVPPAMQGAIL